MESNKMFFKTEIKVVVLSEKPIEFDNLADLNHLITEGPAIGDYTKVRSRYINLRSAKTWCKKLNSDPAILETL
jgi:hypothetical protein